MDSYRPAPLRHRSSWPRPLRAIGLLVVVLLLAVACGTGDDQPGPALGGDGQATDQEPADGGEVDPEAINIGIIDSYSGAASGFAEDKRDSAEMLVNQVNEEGGIAGQEVQLVFRDDSLDPSRATQHINELYTQVGVDVAMGGLSSSVLLAINEWVRENERWWLAWDARTTTVTWEQGHDGIVRTASNVYMDGRAMAQFFADKPFTRWSIIAPDYEYGQAVARNFRESLTELNPDVEFVDPQFPALGEVDFNPFITALQSAEPEIVYVGLFGGDAITFIRQANALGLFDEMEAVFLHAGDSLLRPAGMEMPEGVWVGTNYHWSIDNPENAAFVEQFEAEFGRKPGDYNALGYVGMRFMLSAIEEAGTADGDAVFEALRGMTLDTPVGTVSIREFDGQSDMGLHIGRTVADPELSDQLGLDLEAYVAGSEIQRSVEEIEELRSGGE